MHPLRARNLHTSRRAILVLSLFWLLAFILLLPQLFIQRLEPLLFLKPGIPIRMVMVCVEFFSDHLHNILYTFFFYLVLYLGPMIIMSVTYGIIGNKLWKRRRIGETPDDDRRLIEKKRIVRMLVVIVILFSVSWFPFFSCQVYLLFGYPDRDTFRIVMAVLQLIGYSNSCINPFIYCFMNEKFKKSAIQTLCLKCAIKKMVPMRHSSHTFLGTQQTMNSILTEQQSMLGSPARNTTLV